MTLTKTPATWSPRRFAYFRRKNARLGLCTIEHNERMTVQEMQIGG